MYAQPSETFCILPENILAWLAERANEMLVSIGIEIYSKRGVSYVGFKCVEPGQAVEEAGM